MTNEDLRKMIRLNKLAIKAIEKQTPKMVNYTTSKYTQYNTAECPNCKKDDYDEYFNNWGYKFCPNCGQALKWEKKE